MIFVYCHGKRVVAHVLGDGWALCGCGQRIRVVA